MALRDDGMTSGADLKQPCIGLRQTNQRAGSLNGKNKFKTSVSWQNQNTFATYFIAACARLYW
jgi:hypothetical protein